VVVGGIWRVDEEKDSFGGVGECLGGGIWYLGVYW